MKKIYRSMLTVLFLGSYLLSACGGVPLQQDDSSNSSTSSRSTEVVFTGTVQSMGGAQWLIDAQQVDVYTSTVIDPNIQVGDIVRVEASVFADGSVVASKIESSNVGENNANTSNDNSNTDDNNVNSNSNSDNGNVNDNSSSDDDLKIYGIVDALTENTITIDGVVYNLTDFTEFDDVVSVGDEVKIHLIIGEDRTPIIREIELSSSGDGSSNSNVNFNGNSNDDDHNYSISNTNGNSNDDDDDDHDNSNSNYNGNSNDDD